MPTSIFLDHFVSFGQTRKVEIQGVFINNGLICKFSGPLPFHIPCLLTREHIQSVTFRRNIESCHKYGDRRLTYESPVCPTRTTTSPFHDIDHCLYVLGCRRENKPHFCSSLARKMHSADHVDRMIADRRLRYELTYSRHIDHGRAALKRDIAPAPQRL